MTESRDIVECLLDIDDSIIIIDKSVSNNGIDRGWHTRHEKKNISYNHQHSEVRRRTGKSFSDVKLSLCESINDIKHTAITLPSLNGADTRSSIDHTKRTCNIDFSISNRTKLKFTNDSALFKASMIKVKEFNIPFHADTDNRPNIKYFNNSKFMMKPARPRNMRLKNDVDRPGMKTIKQKSECLIPKLVFDGCHLLDFSPLADTDARPTDTPHYRRKSPLNTGASPPTPGDIRRLQSLSDRHDLEAIITPTSHRLARQPNTVATLADAIEHRHHISVNTNLRMPSMTHRLPRAMASPFKLSSRMPSTVNYRLQPTTIDTQTRHGHRIANVGHAEKLQSMKLGSKFEISARHRDEIKHFYQRLNMSGKQAG